MLNLLKTETIIIITQIYQNNYNIWIIKLSILRQNSLYTEQDYYHVSAQIKTIIYKLSFSSQNKYKNTMS